MTKRQSPINAARSGSKIVRYLSGVAMRKAARKSRWHLLTPTLFLPLAFAATGGILFGLWRVHQWLFEPHWSTFGAVLAMLGVLVAVVPFAGMLTNLIIWLIKPARLAMERDAVGVKGASFKEVMPGMLKLTPYFYLPGMIVASIGVIDPIVRLS